MHPKRHSLFTAGIALSATLAALGATPARAAVDVPADNPNIQYFGRFDFSNPKQPACDWPGCYIETRFTGTSIAVKLSGGTNDFNVFIDGQAKPKIAMSNGKTTYVAASALADGSHSLLLTKRTEGFSGVTAFTGFQLDDGKSLQAPPPRAVAKKIQFIGDSFTAGYGDEATVVSCPERQPYDNNYVAYGPVTARALGAEYSVQAVSGIGLVHNYGDSLPLSANPLPAYFDRTLFGRGAPTWDMTKWIPDLIVIALGTNDFSTMVKPSETQYTGAYKAFLARLRGWWPNAEILCLTYSVDDYQKKYADSVVARATAAGDAKIHRIHLPPLGNGDVGCDWHPNVSGQQKYANALIPAARQYLGIPNAIKPPRRPSHTSRRPAETGMLPLPVSQDPAHPTWVDARGRFLDLPILP
jgi:endoglucanase